MELVPDEPRECEIQRNRKKHIEECILGEGNTTHIGDDADKDVGSPWDYESNVIRNSYSNEEVIEKLNALAKLEEED